MRIFLKKIFILLAALALAGQFAVSGALAETQSDSASLQAAPNGSKEDSGDSHKSEGDNAPSNELRAQTPEEQDAEEVDNLDAQEHSLNQSVEQDSQKFDENKIAEVESSSIQTYGDAVDYLKKLQANLADLKSGLSNGLQPDTSLSPTEQQLFDKLAGSHRESFTAAQQRIDQLDAVIQEMIDLLTPIADQPVTEELGLKELLINSLKSLHEQVSGLKDLGGLNFDILQTETQ